MAIYFNEKLRQLRRDRDLTQEELADIFHVSPQSVSRWETGANYPDIEILPHIAGFFDVTVDELLGTAHILSEEKAAERRRDIRNLLNSGRAADAVEAARQAVKEFPVNYSLQGHLLQALCTLCAEAEENNEKYKSEIIAVGERIINYCTDQDACLWGKYQLIRQYVKWGMKDEARRIAYSLPAEAYYTQDIMLEYVLEGEEWERQQRNRIVRFTIMLCDRLGAYANSDALDVHQKIECHKAMLQIESLAYQVAGEEPDTVNHVFLYVHIAGLCCEAGDTENALAYVEKAAETSMRHVKQMYETNSDGSNYYAWPTTRNLCWILWEDYLSAPQFDVVREDARFVKCNEQLKAHSNEVI